MCDEKNEKNTLIETAVDTTAAKPAEQADEIKAPVSEICGSAQANAANQVDDDSEIKPVEGFFLTSQRWH
jgi:hypothetical protein